MRSGVFWQRITLKPFLTQSLILASMMTCSLLFRTGLCNSRPSSMLTGLPPLLFVSMKRKSVLDFNCKIPASSKVQPGMVRSLCCALVEFKDNFTARSDLQWGFAKCLAVKHFLPNLMQIVNFNDARCVHLNKTMTYQPVHNENKYFQYSCRNHAGRLWRCRAGAAAVVACIRCTSLRC